MTRPPSRPSTWSLEHPHRIARVGWIVFAILVLVLMWWVSRRPDPAPPPPPHEALRVATFNIRNYPESDRQRRGALEAIAELDAPVIALQEITDPDDFDAQVERVLGDDWATVFVLLPERRRRSADGLDEPPPRQHLGVLYDTHRFELRSTRVHPLLIDRGKPALEVRLHEHATGADLRVFTVHLKAFDEGFDQRLAQLQALQPIIERAIDTGERVVVLGDFNSTTLEDRRVLADFAADTDTIWASQGVRCTEYWDPQRDGQCQASPLDHLFSWQPPDAIEALGPCRELDCAADRCPVFYREVSDHCPVVATW